MEKFYDFWSWLTESKAAKKVLKLAETGIVFEKIVRKNLNGINIGIDLSLDMLGKAKQRLQNLIPIILN